MGVNLPKVKNFFCAFVGPHNDSWLWPRFVAYLLGFHPTPQRGGLDQWRCLEGGQPSRTGGEQVEFVELSFGARIPREEPPQLGRFAAHPTARHRRPE